MKKTLFLMVLMVMGVMMSNTLLASYYFNGFLLENKISLDKGGSGAFYMNLSKCDDEEEDCIL